MKRWLIFLLLLAVAVSALARVGGGDSYSGGGSSGGGGGGGSDGGGELLWLVLRFLIWLTFEHPAIGIPVDIAVIACFIAWKRRNAGKNVRVVRVETASASAPRAAESLDGLKRFDPNFSEITFADFCYSLYARAHHARGIGDLQRYTLYLSNEARRVLAANNPRGLREVKGIIIGSFRILSVSGLDSPQVRVTIVYESNYTEVTGDAEETWYAREHWVLERKRDILSPPPEKAKADHCPRCGAALQTRTDGSCDYCGVRIDSGAFHWFVRNIPTVNRESRGPLLTSNVPERGTDRPTIRQPHFPDARAAFERQHPDFRWDDFIERVRDIARELQDAWTAREWERVRPLETESLFQMHRYWIDAYKRQGLRNVVEGFEVTRVEPVKIDHDAFYESITVRLWAHGRDHTVDHQGNVVSGSNTNLRSWTEYWTFIRSRGGHERRNVKCPNCGAPVDAGATGICHYCGGKLTSGQFDWVLSRIEQDESYGG